mgnify:CR=1 FL=1
MEVRDPRVLSDRSNLIVELAPAPVVARVATSTADVRPGGARGWLARDVALAAHLAAAGADVVRPARTPPAGPHMEDGLAMTFWEKVKHDASSAPAPREAGEALGRLHQALEDFPGDLPPFSALLDECDAVIERLDERTAASERLGAPSVSASPAMSPASADRLRSAVEDIRSTTAAAGLPPRPLHGDASRSNLLACLALSTRQDAAEALDAYGRPLDEALEPFMEARRLQGALWTALLAERHPELRERAEERLRRWAPPG